MTTVIGFSGKAHSGKDSAGELVLEFLQENFSHKVVKKNFADTIKEYCAIKYSVPIMYFYDSRLKEIKHPFWKVSPRQILQFEGTEATRDIIANLIPWIKTDFWIQRLAYGLQGQDIDYCIICDVRFQNEADWILQYNNGLLFNIRRPGADGMVGLTNHASEQGYIVSEQWKGITYHEVDNDGSLEELKLKIIPLIMQGLRS